jgi:hypothetical protein
VSGSWATKLLALKTPFINIDIFDCLTVSELQKKMQTRTLEGVCDVRENGLPVHVNVEHPSQSQPDGYPRMKFVYLISDGSTRVAEAALAVSTSFIFADIAPLFFRHLPILYSNIYDERNKSSTQWRPMQCRRN